MHIFLYIYFNPHSPIWGRTSERSGFFPKDKEGNARSFCFCPHFALIVLSHIRVLVSTAFLMLRLFFRFMLTEPNAQRTISDFLFNSLMFSKCLYAVYNIHLSRADHGTLSSIPYIRKLFSRSAGTSMKASIRKEHLLQEYCF